MKKMLVLLLCLTFVFASCDKLEKVQGKLEEKKAEKVVEI